MMGEPRRPIGAGSGEDLAAPQPVASQAGGNRMTGPRLARLVVACSISGYAISGAFIMTLALLDPDRLGHVLFQVGGAPVVALLWFFIGAAFTLAQLATSIRLQHSPSSGTRVGHALPRGWGLGWAAARGYACAGNKAGAPGHGRGAGFIRAVGRWQAR
jgi:hypothetical protein